MDRLKLLKKSRAVPLIQTVRGLALTSPADEILFKHARIVSEGEIVKEQGRCSTYYGSTLLTIDLDRDIIDLGPVATDLHRLCDLVRSSVLFRLRLLRLARLEAERRSAPNLLGEMSAQTDFKVVDRSLFVDINIECPLVTSKARSFEGSE